MKTIKCISSDLEPVFMDGKSYEVWDTYRKIDFTESIDINVWDEDDAPHRLTPAFRKIYFEQPKVLKGSEWKNYLMLNPIRGKKQEEIYRATHNYVACYKTGDYYFCFEITRGYLSLTSLKRAISVML